VVRISIALFAGAAAVLLSSELPPAQGQTKPGAIQSPAAGSMASNTDPDHTLPQSGEPRHVHVPSRHDVEAREKLQVLVRLTDEQLTAELHKWPRYQKMSFGEKAKFLQRIQDIRDHRKNAAANRARELNLNLTPEQQITFEKSYWDKKLQSERALSKETEPRRKELDEQMNQQLLKEFGSASNPPK
jgi:hypothetical protein